EYESGAGMFVLQIIIIATLSAWQSCSDPEFLEPPPTNAPKPGSTGNGTGDQVETEKTTTNAEQTSSTVEEGGPQSEQPEVDPKKECMDSGKFFDDKIFGDEAQCMTSIELFAGKSLGCKVSEAQAALPKNLATQLAMQVEAIG